MTPAPTAAPITGASWASFRVDRFTPSVAATRREAATLPLVCPVSATIFCQSAAENSVLTFESRGSVRQETVALVQDPTLRGTLAPRGGSSEQVAFRERWRSRTPS